MRRKRAYVDTSVFGGTRDDEFPDAGGAFLETVRSGSFTILLSDETVRELLKAPLAVRQVWLGVPPECVEPAEINEEVKALAENYVAAAVLSRNSESDAIHVAAATVAGADLIVSWNFRHMVNYERILGFNGVNVRHGYRSMVILSPMEVSRDESEDL